MRAFGKYRLVEPIASGGMAEVWRAEAPGAEGFVKEVALKLIRGDHDARGDFVRMFVQEARLASRLAHGNIVQVFDFDQVQGRYYIAMELVRGRTLREVVDRCREQGIRFGLARAVHVCAEVARALAYAHRVEVGGAGGLVHRDVSPQNVLISFEGEVKLTDFGIARAMGSAEVTSPGTVKGKLAYMAPEQARGGVVDARVDVFAVGVILWELCTGRRLFARESDAAMLAAVVASEPITPPSAWNETVPPELDAIVLGALARDAAQRTASAEELAASLSSMRLRLATVHEDLDLRALLARLWPEGGAPSRSVSVERTALRPVSGADAGGALERPTRTALRARRRFGSSAVTSVLVAAGAAGALALAGVGSGRRAPVLVAEVNAGARAASGTAAETAAVPSIAVAPPAPGRAPGPGPAPATAAPAAPPAVPAAKEGGEALEPGRAPEVQREPSLRRRAGAPRRSERPSSGQGRRRQAQVPEPRGEGIVAVHATPWAYVTIDGHEAGETPLETDLPARQHRLRARHPTLGEDEIVVTLEAGQRFLWKPKLSK